VELPQVKPVFFEETMTRNIAEELKRIKEDKENRDRLKKMQKSYDTVCSKPRK